MCLTTEIDSNCYRKRFVNSLTSPDGRLLLLCECDEVILLKLLFYFFIISHDNEILIGVFFEI